MLAPPGLTESFLQRFRNALAGVLPEVKVVLGNMDRVHIALFDDGDYILFQGLCDRGERHVMKSVRIDRVVAYRLSGRRKNVYRRFTAGATLDVHPTALRASESSGRWYEEIRLGEEYEFLTFGPG